MNSPVQTKLNHWKRNLVDLSRRNRLIHFKPSSSTCLRIVDELPPEVFRMTVLKRSSMSILPKSNEQQESKQTGAYQPYTPDELKAHQIDQALQTDLDRDKLEHNLLATYRKAVSVEEERGYNTLYLALGALEWYETDSSAELFHSPLVLVPVSLDRKQAGKRFYLKSRDDDPILNPALEQRLKNDFSIELPPLPETFDEIDPRAYFNDLAKTFRDRPRWRMTNSVHLSLVSFTKFTMYKDLETHAKSFAAHPLIGILAGNPGAHTKLSTVEPPTGQTLDTLDPRSSYHVMDIDSSQQEAVEAVKSGHNLVIEGPPGTGKSQTIANLIAECLLAGKTVLFVSEKMAALEVVFRRLESCGLGDFCFELHSHKTTRRRVMEELRRVLDLPRSSLKVKAEALTDLSNLREQLNRYVRELREPIAPLGTSPYEALGVVASAGDLPEVRVFLRGAGEWGPERLAGNLRTLGNLTRTRCKVEPVDEHPWRGARITKASYEHRIAIRKALDAVLTAHSQLERLAGDLAAELGTRGAETISDVRELIDLAELIENSPTVERPLLVNDTWKNQEDAIKKIVDLGLDYTQRKTRLLARFDAAILDADVATIDAWWQEHGDKLTRFFKPTYWSYRSMINGWRKPGKSRGAILHDLDEALALQLTARSITEFDGALLGTLWKSTESDWEQLSKVVSWVSRFSAHVRSGLASERCIELAQAGWENRELRTLGGSAADEMDDRWQTVVQLLNFEAPDLPLGALRRRVEAMCNQERLLDEWSSYWAALSESKQDDTRDFVESATAVRANQLADCFRVQFYRSWLEEILPRLDTLRSFDGTRHDEIVEEFRKIDRSIIELNRLRARATLLDRMPDGSWDASSGSDLGRLQREVRKKRGHVPLRRLFSAVPQSLRRLKPCMMMSPMSVAQFLDPSAEPYDIVVFDEASQISPEDAVGAIGRGRQLVVVGDSKQLPPTPFFRIEAPDEEGDVEVGKGDLESVLDECVTVFPQRRMLRWHYRSRSESLIAFSNHTYYSNQLFTFPSPGDEDCRVGVQFVHVKDGVYDRGGTGKNDVEAERVARSVFEHLKAHPEKSVGIGTFGVSQREAIEDALETLRREDPSLEVHFDHAHPEYCFVKNLESIQGDERDVIMLSIGYGRDAAGRISMNFGPLNQDGGARRLNVLVTRARERVIVYSSITPEDIDLERTSAEGVENLRSYLDYARRGPRSLDTPRTSQESHQDELHKSIQEALASKNVEVAPNVGFSGYRIDFAVSDEKRGILAIECDGPTYQNAATARDRDRLRSQVLEALGWRLHRVWSVEWFRHPTQELERMLAAISEARNAPKDAASNAMDGENIGSETIIHTNYVEHVDTELENKIEPYVMAKVEELGTNEDFYRERVDRISRTFHDVVRVEGPIHRDEAARRVVANWNITRIGKKIQDVLDSAIARCVRRDEIVEHDCFFWPTSMTEAPIRRRGPDAPRASELIAPQEIEQAVILVLHKEYRIRGDGLVEKVSRVLGFSRTGSRLRTAVGGALESLRKNGRVLETNGAFSLSDGATDAATREAASEDERDRKETNEEVSG